MTDKKYRAISLFSGAGGDTLGMMMAGVDVVGFVEMDKYAIETHNKNFSNCKLIGTDIRKISDEKFREYKGVDIIFGGFPCQSFSHGGKKNPEDSRGFLYREFVRASNIIKPSIIIGENVNGLCGRVDKDGNKILDNIVNDFDVIGYNMKTHIFNMRDYNIPQDRKRIIIYGIRKDLHVKLNLDNVKCTGRKYNKDILEFSLENCLPVRCPFILNLIPDEKYVSDMGDTSAPTGTPPTNLVKCYNRKEFSFGKRSKSTYSCIIDKKDVSRTILSTYGRMPRLFVPVRNKTGSFLRPYTIRELQLIQGFPESFVFCGNHINQIKQIGNAVPPNFIFYIMEYIVGILSEDIIEI